MADSRATRALVLGLLSLPFGVLAPFAIWTAIRSLGHIRATDGVLRGATRATAGLVGGILGLASFVIGTAYWFLAS
jgi:hypothetical protein